MTRSGSAGVPAGTAAPRVTSAADLDPDALAAAVTAVPGVASLGGGIAGEVATYLPGRRVAGVRLTDEAAEVHVVLRPGVTVPEVDRAVRSALARVAPGVEVRLFIDDIADPETERA